FGSPCALQLLVMVAEGAGLRRAAARAGNGVPSGRRIFVGLGRAGVGVDARAPGKRSEINRAPSGRWQRKPRQAHPHEMPARAVFLRYTQVLWGVLTDGDFPSGL